MCRGHCLYNDFLFREFPNHDKNAKDVGKGITLFGASTLAAKKGVKVSKC